jgi:chromosome segregation ATPase
MPDDSQWSLQLPACLDTQAELLAALIELGLQQVDAITGSRMNELLSLLARKQSLLDALAANALSLRTLQQHLQSADASLSAQRRQACQEKHALATARFDELFELERRCERLLSESRDQLAGRLQQTVHSLSVADAYRQEPGLQTQGGQLDLSSSD